MKNSFLIILILLYSVCLAEDENNIEFQYGILLKQVSNPDSIIVIENESIVNHRDRVKINVGYSPASYFYVIFLDSDSIYDKLYAKKGLSSDSLYYDTALTWVPFNDSKGFETLFLINSKDKLNDLESSLNNYKIAKKRIKKKIGIEIQDILKNLSSSYRDIDDFATSLDAPIIGGVSFRGEEDDSLNDFHVTHTCTGNNKIAIKKIILTHK